MNARLEELATTDGLTGLKNRRTLLERLEDFLGLCRRFPQPLSLLLINVDHFKKINDTYGHPAGDQCLVALANLFRNNSRSIDTVARYGGEEFALLLPNTDKGGSLTVAEPLRGAVEAYSWPNHPVTVSVGASTLTPQITTTDLLLGSADQALYHSKQTGRNRVTHIEVLGVKC